MKDSVLYEGRFSYVGGHPDVTPSDTKVRSKVRVTPKGIDYIIGSRDKIAFTIPAAEIKLTNWHKGFLSLYTQRGEFVNVVMERKDQESTVAFKALGTSNEKDIAAFITAINKSRAKARGRKATSTKGKGSD